MIPPRPTARLGSRAMGPRRARQGYSLGTTDVMAGGNSLGSSDVLIVQDGDRVLQAVDRVVAQLDVQPVQVMIEASWSASRSTTTWNWG